MILELNIEKPFVYNYAGCLISRGPDYWCYKTLLTGFQKSNARKVDVGFFNLKIPKLFFTFDDIFKINSKITLVLFTKTTFA